MGFRELFVSSSPTFAGLQNKFQESEYIVFGVPFDGTSTYRAGARFAPLAIREASQNIETYSFRSGIDVEDLNLFDLGDLHVSGEVEGVLERVRLVLKDLLNEEKIPVCIGGEHTVTLGAVRSLDKKVAVISFDAHLDLRNEYMGRTTSHATFMRRISEEIGPEKILEIGVRAICREELDHAKKVGIKFITAQKIVKNGLKKTTKKVREFLADHKKIYLTIDMDVLDPSFASAVQNPEPDGITIHTLLDILYTICDNRIKAFDVVEVTPHYDQGITAIQAAKTIFEVLCYVEHSRKANG